MNATATAPKLSREEILQEISECETRLIELRSLLPTTIKSFFRYRVRPGKYAIIYADTREVADAKLRERMDKDYPPDELNQPTWWISSKVVDVFHDPAIAAANSSGNLLTSLSAADAEEFARDYRENERGRVDEHDRPKHLPKSQVERDVETWEARQRKKC